MKECSESWTCSVQRGEGWMEIFQYLEEAYKKDEDRLFSWACWEYRFSVDTRKKLLAMREVKDWSRLLREVSRYAKVSRKSFFKYIRGKKKTRENMIHCWMVPRWWRMQRREVTECLLCFSHCCSYKPSGLPNLGDNRKNLEERRLPWLRRII